MTDVNTAVAGVAIHARYGFYVYDYVYPLNRNIMKNNNKTRFSRVLEILIAIVCVATPAMVAIMLITGKNPAACSLGAWISFEIGIISLMLLSIVKSMHEDKLYRISHNKHKQ